MALIAGYDIGGAHLKIALVENGVTILVEQMACPLWRGLGELDAALQRANNLTQRADLHAVTMTGELADIFPDRYTGVVRIIEQSTAQFGPATRFWMGHLGLGDGQAAIGQTGSVASTNFLATAEVAARHIGQGLVIDMGSTTTDIIAIAAGSPSPRGLTDAERLTTGELVYSGLTRTPVMAVTSRGLYGGVWQTLARDPFATMADVRRVLGTLPEDVDVHRTADGRGTSVTESRARLARCFGRDVGDTDGLIWEVSARMIHETQLTSLMEGVLQVTSAQARVRHDRTVVAGIGSAIAAEVASRLGCPHIAFGDLVPSRPDCRAWATRCAPAVAVAMLAGQ